MLYMWQSRTSGRESTQNYKCQQLLTNVSVLARILLVRILLLMRDVVLMSLEVGRLPVVSPQVHILPHAINVVAQITLLATAKHKQ